MRFDPIILLDAPLDASIIKKKTMKEYKRQLEEEKREDQKNGEDKRVAAYDAVIEKFCS